MNEHHEPTRLVDDPGTSAALRQDLQAASGTPPLAYSVEQGLAGLQSSLAGESAAGAAVATQTSKLGLMGVATLLVAVGVGLWWVGGGDGAETPQTAEASVVELAANDVVSRDAAPAPKSGASEGTANAEVATAEIPNPNAELQQLEGSAEEPAANVPGAGAYPRGDPKGGEAENLGPVVAHEARPARAKSPALEPASAFMKEAQMVQQAKKALASQPAKSLRLLRDIDRQFPEGQLMEERQGLRALGLIGSGKTAKGRAQAERYLAEHPTGTVASRVRAALAGLE